MSDSESDELYLEDEWSEGNEDFLIDEYLEDMAIEGDWFTDSEDEEEEVELDQEYKFFNTVELEEEVGIPHTREEMRGWVQDTLEVALGHQLDDAQHSFEPSYSLVLEQAQDLQGVLGAWKSRSASRTSQ